MKFENRLRLLSDVKNECAKDPSLLSDLISAATLGVNEYAKKARQSQADMEVVAAMAMNLIKEGRVSKQVKEANLRVMLSKLKQNESELCCNWDDLLDVVKEQQK